MDIDIFLPAGVQECLDHIAGIPVSPKLVQREHAVHLEPPWMAGAAGGRNERVIHEHAEYAFVLRICLLVPVVGPDFFGQREFLLGKLAGDGAGHGGVLLVRFGRYERKKVGVASSEMLLIEF